MKKVVALLRKSWWIILLPVSLGVYFTLTCSKPSAGTCPIESLLLDAEDLPGGNWGETGSRSTIGAPSRLGVERIGTSFVNPEEGGLNHEVYRFANLTDAMEGYEDLAGSWFYPNEKRSEWDIPPQLENLSINASQDQLGCSIYQPTGEEVCQWIALYETYTIFFSYGIFLNTDDQNMRYENIRILITKIDQKMAGCPHP